MENIDEAVAKTLEQDSIMALEALYADALSPYPGDISRDLVKDERFRPQKVTNDAGTYYLLYANERFGYGAGTSEAVKFASVAGWRYCDQRRRFLKIRLFAPHEAVLPRLEALFNSVRCASKTSGIRPIVFGGSVQ